MTDLRKVKDLNERKRIKEIRALKERNDFIKYALGLINEDYTKEPEYIQNIAKLNELQKELTN